MSRYKVTLSYNGSNYHGWQTQHANNSIEEQVEAALASILGAPCEVFASGRTDAKVHAFGQVLHFDSSLNMTEQDYLNALNALLPKDIRIQKIELVDHNFHARFNTTGKRYDYYLSSDVSNPFLYDFMGMESKVLDIDVMQKCAQLFIGTHDFTSFTSCKIDPRKSRKKTISRFDVLQEDKTTHFILKGDGFLRYMVRMLVQTLIEAGKHKISVTDVKMMLEGKDKHLCHYKAQPQGLYLVSVDYD